MSTPSNRVGIIIPARMGSRRLKRKMLLDLKGNFLLHHTWQRAVEANIGEVWVATDDQEIFDAVGEFGGKVVMTADGIPSGTDRCAAAVEILGLDDNDIIINLQGDEPLIPPENLRLLADYMKKHDCEMGTLASPLTISADSRRAINVHCDPSRPKVVTTHAGRALYFSRSPIPYLREDSKIKQDIFMHIGVYAFRVKNLREYSSLPESELEKIEELEQLRPLQAGWNIGVAITSNPGFGGVNTQDDLDRARKQLQT